jgi:hypothetical protein
MIFLTASLMAALLASIAAASCRTSAQPASATAAARIRIRSIIFLPIEVLTDGQAAGKSMSAAPACGAQGRFTAAAALSSVHVCGATVNSERGGVS